MTDSSRFGNSPRLLRGRLSKRRPSGISRRKKRQLTLESLEDRRMMAGYTDTVYIGGVPYEAVSYSSADAAGAEAILLQEYNRYLEQVAGASSTKSYVRGTPTDPLLEDQWHLINIGQEVGQPDFQDIFGVAGEDINVQPVWEMGYKGTGVQVAVIDSGVEWIHEDLAGNIDPNLQLDALDQDGDASPEIVPFPEGFPELNDLFNVNAHGTAVAGIIGAVGNNGLGGTGIAYDSQIVPIRLIDGPRPIAGTVDAFRFQTDVIDITNNSWGPSDLIRSYEGPTAPEVLALRDSVIFGRDGLGVIHTWAAGNGANTTLDFAGYDGWVNSRYTIGVTSVDHDGQYNNVDGTVTGLAEISPSVLVAAPDGSQPLLSLGGDVDVGSGIVTTDVSGDDIGFNIAPDPDTGQEFDRDFLEDTNYTSLFGDTSASAPMVAGVIALMLEANPNLSWRDVQEILVRAARQNAEFATMADGDDLTTGEEYQSSWITNQVPVFHDPDVFDPLISNVTQVVYPTLDPRLTLGENAIHYAPTPQVLTNGAGYTVSQGRGTNNEATGFAHGVVDAELSVLLAEQWHLKEQDLPNELSFTTAVGLDRANSLPAAAIVNDGDLNAAELIVPGGYSGDPGFIAYWNEYFVDDPDFSQNFPGRGAPLEFSVPESNNMTVETVEVILTLPVGDVAEFLDHTRVLLISPDGTHSELNHYFVDPTLAAGVSFHQTEDAVNPNLSPNGSNAVENKVENFDNPGSVFTGLSTLSFSTNRSWGERSDDSIMFDPTTNEPIIDPIGGNLFNAVDNPSIGDLLSQGWQIHLENYGNTNLTIASFEIVWHGSPIGANTERVHGLVGIDDNRDDLFNYSRVLPQPVDEIDGDPTTLRLGEFYNLVDPDHESMASNVTVFAYRDVDSDGILNEEVDILVDQFVTGADGNYYFDLVPADYILTLDPGTLGGLQAIDDPVTDFLPDYLSTWVITEDYFTVWDYDSNLDVPLNPVTDAPAPFFDGNGDVITYGMQHINFLLQPTEDPPTEVEFRGTVFADLAGDGVFNDEDVELPDQLVFGDVNRNGSLDSGEVFTTTDENGEYTLLVPAEIASVINVGVRPPAGWNTANPAAGFHALFVEPGDVEEDQDFFLQPPAGTTPGNGSSLAGIVLGHVFFDPNEDGIKQSGESGVQNITVYLDENGNLVRDNDEPFAVTNENGGYAITGLEDDNYLVRLDLDGSSALFQTFPFSGAPQTAAVISGGTVNGERFGIAGGFTMDFGDLPDLYDDVVLNPNDLEGPARHNVGGYYLGSLIDAEASTLQVNGSALGDDMDNLNDEDGVVLVGDTLDPGTTETFVVTASLFGAVLQVWMDFDGNGDFDGPGDNPVTDLILSKGENFVTIDIPSITTPGTTVYARFRYGGAGLGLTGAAPYGEVEDYGFDVTPAPEPDIEPLVIDSDFDGDGMVTGFDFLAWQLGFGASSGAANGDGDANGDEAVDHLDLVYWEVGYGEPVETIEEESAQAAEQEQLPPPLSEEPLATLLASEVEQSGSGANDEHSLTRSSTSVSPVTAVDSDPVLSPVDLDEEPNQSIAPIVLTTVNETPIEEPLVELASASQFDTGLLAFDSEVERLFRGFYRFDRDKDLLSATSRFENRLQDTFSDLGEVLESSWRRQGEAVDDFFGKLDRELPWTPERSDGDDHDSQSALAEVLEDEFHWRFA